MNFHIFVAISTFLFFILLKIIITQNKNPNQNQNNLIYVLFVPCLLYIYHFLYEKKIGQDGHGILTDPYPLSESFN